MRTWLFWGLLWVVASSQNLRRRLQEKTYVKIFHFLINHWGDSKQGIQTCAHMPNIECEWMFSPEVHTLKQHINDTYKNFNDSNSKLVTATVYNIHSWWERFRSHSIAVHACDLKTDLTIVESEESYVRYNHLFKPSFKEFDGNSTTMPTSSIQRVYKEAFLNQSIPLVSPMVNFSSLIKAGTYVASDCHKRDSANSNRDWYIQQLRNAGFRVDGLGRCMHSIGPENIQLPNSRDSRYNLYLKRDIISKFMFHFAFENSIENGYVTEKPFDALIAGTVPVYLGDSAHLRSLLPHPSAAIFVSDYDNMTQLADYLNFLTTNETAYEAHRVWHHDYNYQRHIADKPILQNSWFCRVCEWASKAVREIPYNDTWFPRSGVVCPAT